VDLGLTYGPEFNFLNGIKPVSVMLAEGSSITVEQKKEIAFSKQLGNFFENGN